MDSVGTISLSGQQEAFSLLFEILKQTLLGNRNAATNDVLWEAAGVGITQACRNQKSPIHFAITINYSKTIWLRLGFWAKFWAYGFLHRTLFVILTNSVKKFAWIEFTKQSDLRLKGVPFIVAFRCCNMGHIALFLPHECSHHTASESAWDAIKFRFDIGYLVLSIR